MADSALASFLAAYTRYTRGFRETEAQREARILAWEALPPFQQAVASVLYILDNQVGGNRPNAEVVFYASSLQDLADKLYAAMQQEAATPAIEEPAAPGV